MKIHLLLFFLGVSLWGIADIHAQELLSIMDPDLTSKEYRERKKVLKDTAREYYWNLEKFEELLRARGQYQQQNQKSDSLAKAQKDLLAEMERLKKVEENSQTLEEQTKQLKAELAEVSRQMAENQQNTSLQADPETHTKDVNGHIPETGLYFTIQIGAYKRDNLQILSQKAQGQTIMTEKAEGLNKYLIGLFDHYEEAKTKMTELLALGLPEAWVVAYKDGQRIPLKDASEYTASLVGSE